MNAMDSDFGFLTESKIVESLTALRTQVRNSAEGEGIAIVGSADLPRKCAKAIIAAGGKVLFFIEYDPLYWGREVDGHLVVGPNEAIQLAGPNILCVSAIWSPNHSYAETREWLGVHGFKRILPVSSLFWAYPDQLPPHYQLEGPLVYARGRAKIERLMRSMGDDESRRHLRDHLQWRVSLDPNFIPTPDHKHVYFDPRLFHLGADAVVADVGAFDGDSLRRFLFWQGEDFGQFHAIEPDPVNYSRLKAYVERLPKTISSRIVLHNVGIGNAQCKLRVTPTGKQGSKIDLEGEFEINIERLDMVFANQRLDYIKFDIEGAERDALQGCWSVVHRDRPILAVAVYHRADDIFEIPLSIIEKVDNYHFALRSHDNDGIDLVFYAIPKEKALV